MKTKMRRRGGETKREERKEEDREEVREGERKEIGKIAGEHAKGSAARSPRKDGGGVGADSRPFSSAKGGTKPAGRHMMSDD